MPPIPRDVGFDPLLTAKSLIDQWTAPKEIFTILFLVTGNIIAWASAQLAGGILTPVLFSFGWVSYVLTILIPAIRKSNLMPPPTPDAGCKVINGSNGYKRQNESWILGRMVRDFDHWAARAVKEKTTELVDRKWAEVKTNNPNAARPPVAGLVVAIYKPSETKPHGVVKRDFLYWSSIFTMVVQLGIAAIPLGLWGNWGILLVTACGNVLALGTSSLPQWKAEKWACRDRAQDTYVLTKSNGSQHAIVILGNGRGFNLDDLAAGPNHLHYPSGALRKVFFVGILILWLGLLITAAGLTSNTWFLLATGGLGLAQNYIVSDIARTPEAFGIPLDYVEVFGEMNVMDTLLEVERHYPRLGRSISSEFFPGNLRPEEVRVWEEFDRAPDATAPDARAPDARAPDATAPDARAPDTRAPDARAPDARAPDARAPDARAPDARAPDATAPDARAPDTRAPDATAPDA